MSSCLVLQQNKNIFIASDTAISSTVLGKRIRVSNSGEKVFIKNNNIIFCSGNVKLANKCKSFIMGMEELDMAKLHSFLLETNSQHTMFEVFIGVVGDTVKSYQLSSYNSFEPIERVVERNTEIFALGFNTKSMLQSFENNLSKTNVLEAFRKSYVENICNEVGGNVDICYFYNGELQKVRYDLNDETECLLDRFNEEYLHYIMAEQLIGKVILGEQLFIGNGDNTFKILPDGLYIYDQNSSHELRVFLGIKDGKAKLELYSSSGNNNLVLSENGIYSCYQISDRDSFDYSKSFKSYFYIPGTLKETFEAKLIVRLEKFRAYSKASKSKTINLTSTETKSFESKTTGGSGTIAVNISGVTGGAGFTTVTGSGKSTSQSYNFTTGSYGGVVSGTTSSPYGSANEDQGNIDMNSHYHWVKLSHTHATSADCGSHTHSINLTGSASANTHTHTFTVPTHSHGIIMPSHDHSLEYGIFEHDTVPACKVYLNGVDLGITMNQEKEYVIDVTDKFKTLKNGMNTIEIKTTNTTGLGRASFTLFWGGYFNYH